MKQANAPKPVRLGAIAIAHRGQTCAGEGQTCAPGRTDTRSIYIIYGQPTFFSDLDMFRSRVSGFSREASCLRITILNNPLGIPSNIAWVSRELKEIHAEVTP